MKWAMMSYCLNIFKISTKGNNKHGYNECSAQLNSAQLSSTQLGGINHLHDENANRVIRLTAGAWGYSLVPCFSS